MDNPGEPLDIEKYDYRGLIGSVNYLANTTRPDLAFAAHSLAAFNNSPCENHWITGKHIVRYLQGTIDYKLILTEPIKGIEMFCDSDFAGDTTTRKSTTGYAVSLGSGMIAWSSRKQTLTATSTIETEVYAASEAAKEIIYLNELFKEIDVNLD